MARSLYDPAVREATLVRLDRLRPEAPARWGRMNAPQMVAHLTEAFRMPNGELHIRRRPMPLRRLVKWLILYVLPMPKGAPTSRELLARVPESWADDLARLRAAIAAVRRPGPGAPVGDHPIFGTMSVEDWGVLLWKHTDHHLRQFGI